MYINPKTIVCHQINCVHQGNCVLMHLFLTDESYQELTKRFKDNILKKTETQKELFRDYKVDDIFTNVVMQLGKKEHEYKNKQEKGEVLRSYVSPTNTVVERTEQLFMPNEDTQNPKLILLTGRAGSGKTMFSKKLVRDWASDRLFDDKSCKNKFWFVFRYSFRELNGIVSCGHLNFHEFLNWLHALGEDEYKYIIKHPEATLIVLDGFDELKGGFADSLYEVPQDNGKMSLAAVCVKLATGKLFTGATLLVTSRTKEIEQMRQIERFNRKVEILGFAPENVEQYIEKYLKGNDKLDTVRNHIKHNSKIAGICYVPVNCFIMCTVLDGLLPNNATYSTQEVNLPSTVTELYEKVLQFFFAKTPPRLQRENVFRYARFFSRHYTYVGKAIGACLETT